MAITTELDTSSRSGADGSRLVYVCPSCGVVYDAAPDDPAPECDCDEDCEHRDGSGEATDADLETYATGDQCSTCGCTLGADGYWYIDADQAPVHDGNPMYTGHLPRLRRRFESGPGKATAAQRSDGEAMLARLAAAHDGTADGVLVIVPWQEFAGYCAVVDDRTGA